MDKAKHIAKNDYLYKRYYKNQKSILFKEKFIETDNDR